MACPLVCKHICVGKSIGNARRPIKTLELYAADVPRCLVHSISKSRREIDSAKTRARQRIATTTTTPRFRDDRRSRCRWRTTNNNNNNNNNNPLRLALTRWRPASRRAPPRPWRFRSASSSTSNRWRASAKPSSRAATTNAWPTSCGSCP